MGTFKASKGLLPGYRKLDIENYQVYVPGPGQPGERISPQLVRSVLEMIADECGMEHAKVIDEKVVIPTPRERSHTFVAGTPSGKDIRKALERIGYSDRR